MDELYTLCYVGLDAIGANSAVDRGFSPGTLFAKRMEDAVGKVDDTKKYVCAVVFPNTKHEVAWQFIKFSEHIPADRIYWCKMVSLETVHRMPDSERLRYFTGDKSSEL